MSGAISKVAEAVIPSATKAYHTAVGAIATLAVAAGALVCGTQGELGAATALVITALLLGSLVASDIVEQHLSR